MASKVVEVKLTEVDTVKQLIAELTARAKRAELLVRSVDLFGTGFLWRRPDGTEHVLDPAEVSVFIAADQQSEREQLTARAERAEATIQRAQPVLDAVAAWRAAELPPDAHNKVFGALNALAIAWDAYAHPEDSTDPTGGTE